MGDPPGEELAQKVGCCSFSLPMQEELPGCRANVEISGGHDVELIMMA
jgi:hypothetical protein